MGFFQDLGLDEIVASVRDIATEINGLKDDFISGAKDDSITSVTEPMSEFNQTIQAIADDVTGESAS